MASTTALNQNRSRALASIRASLATQAWAELDTNQSCRDAFQEIGNLLISTIVSRAATKSLLRSKHASVENHTFVLHTLLSNEVFYEIYQCIPRYKSTAASSASIDLRNDAKAFFAIYTGAYINHATHGPRGIQPWWEFVLENIANAAVKSLNPRVQAIPRKRKATADQTKSKRAKGNLGRENTTSNTPLTFLVAPLADHTNALGTSAVAPTAKEQDASGRTIPVQHKLVKRGSENAPIHNMQFNTELCSARTIVVKIGAMKQDGVKGAEESKMKAVDMRYQVGTAQRGVMNRNEALPWTDGSGSEDDGIRRLEGGSVLLLQAMQLGSSLRTKPKCTQFDTIFSWTRMVSNAGTPERRDPCVEQLMDNQGTARNTHGCAIRDDVGLKSSLEMYNHPSGWVSFKLENEQGN
ncbi:hypothetical protein B0H13DRAFT_1884684 [Mycena leptocephala]|nr:hypothetical protein B0H13DRAFT_1884684 [Mycena leptocephala]